MSSSSILTSSSLYPPASAAAATAAAAAATSCFAMSDAKTVPTPARVPQPTSCKQPADVRDHNVPDRVGMWVVTGLCCKHKHQDWAGKHSEGVEAFVDHGEGYIRVTEPDISLRKQRSEIRAPGVARPTQNLFDKSPIVLESRVEFCLGANLDIRVPAVRYHPSCQELVVARVERVFAHPQVVGESILERRVLENQRAVRGRTARDTAHTAINVCRRRHLNVADC
ncbi:hypothetical protein BC937DRAFT_95578 [Endogone sp. FLAS-F59071]|nr:hypothetical protein BC937DRAFT_95578 [Endogone sp. FLAS-F59071]|eukprot:RUS13277.1 hypothetical protein BC937DRAFT_95578 [Endogone sp. FLAS-F59071]